MFLAGYSAIRTAGVQRTARQRGDFWHCDGLFRATRNALLRDRSPDDYCHIDWLNGGKVRHRAGWTLGDIGPRCLAWIVHQPHQPHQRRQRAGRGVPDVRVGLRRIDLVPSRWADPVDYSTGDIAARCETIQAMCPSLVGTLLCRGVRAAQQRPRDDSSYVDAAAGHRPRTGRIHRSSRTAARMPRTARTLPARGRRAITETTVWPRTACRVVRPPQPSPSIVPTVCTGSGSHSPTSVSRRRFTDRMRSHGQPGRHDDQKLAGCLDGGPVDAVPAKPGLLDDVLGIGELPSMR